MVKKIGACAIAVLYTVFSTYNSFYVYADEMRIENERKEIELEVIDSERHFENVHYNSKGMFEKNYREDLSDCKGIKTDFDDFMAMDKETVDEIIENGTVIIVDVESRTEIDYIDKKYDSMVSNIEAEMERLESVYLSERSGEVIMGYIGSATSEEDGETEGKLIEEGEVIDNILNAIENEQIFASETKLNELEVEVESIGKLEFQIPSLKTAIQPVVGVCKLYNSDFSEYTGETSVTLYCYRGSVWNSGGKKTYYNYILSSAYVSPVNYMGVEGYSVKIGSNNVYTSIIEAAFLDDKEKSSTYSLSAGMGVEGGINTGTLNVTYNASLSNTYSTSSMDVIEKFSYMHANGLNAYCEWYADPEKVVLGQSRNIEPAIVTKSTSLTNCRTSVEGIVLMKNSRYNNTYTYSGKVIELKAVFK